MRAEIFTYSKLHLPRWEVSIPVAREGKRQWIPIRLTCDAIALDTQTQFKVIRRRYPKTVRDDIPFKTRAGLREYLALPADDFALWLANINPARCKLATRPQLEAFIADAKESLQRLLFKPDYVPPDPDAHGVLRVSSRQEMVFACECGRHWRIVTADGRALEVERISGDEGEDEADDEPE